MTFEEWYATQKHQLSNEQVCRVIWDASAREERDACAKVCIDYANLLAGMSYHDHPTAEEAVGDCAEEIKTRSNIQSERGE